MAGYFLRARIVGLGISWVRDGMFSSVLLNLTVFWDYIS